jgi:hypothetical protein
MGGKFAENARAVQRRAALRLRQNAPEHLVPSASQTPVEPDFVVPADDPDIALLAESTGRRLRDDARDDAFTVFPALLAGQLQLHATADDANRGLPWPTWRDCLIAWIRNHGAPAERAIPVELLETLFLSRVVGHHTEIAGTRGWYSTVRDQAQDLFTHRHALWMTP